MRFSQKITVFHGREVPEEGTLVGYGALIEAFNLPMPLPDRLTLISQKNRKYTTEKWQVLTPRYLPDDTLYKQLLFALRYEGVNLLFFKKLFEKLTEEEMEEKHKEAVRNITEGEKNKDSRQQVKGMNIKTKLKKEPEN